MLVLRLSLGFAVAYCWRGQEVATLEAPIKLKDATIELDKKQAELTGSLRTTSGSVQIVAPPQSSDAKSKLESIFKDSGWTVNPSPPTTPIPELNDSKGVAIKASDAEQTKGIIKAFKSAKVGFTNKTDKNGTTYLQLD